MNCYICQSSDFSVRDGAVRDAPEMNIVECKNCSLVFLTSTAHISEGFYESSGMHGSEPMPMDVWLSETERDDQRRFDMLKTMFLNKRLLDFGCGASGFLRLAKNFAAEAKGVEPEARVRSHWEGILNIVPSLEFVGTGYDLITAFHVVEHLPDPRSTLSALARKLKPGGRIVVEVPSASDVLLTLYDCDAFKRFTYWSQHLFLFTASTLETLARQAGLGVVATQFYQRYPISNHLYWLSKGRAGGHQRWGFLDTPALEIAYASTLAAIGKTDTIIAHLEKLD
jgi:SAM-dependent methyltransferase